MKKILIHAVAILLATLLLVVLFGTTHIVRSQANFEPLNTVDITTYPVDIQYKYRLYTRVIAEGLIYQDFKTLKIIINCESRWRHYDIDGTTVLQNYNGGNDFGLGQIHSPSWEKHLASLGIDMWTPEGNIDGIIYIYKNYGARQWVCPV